SPDHGLYYYVANGVIRRFDTSSGQFDWDYTLGGQGVGIYAASPDGTLWLQDPNTHELVHVGSRGQVLCTYSSDPAGEVLGLAADENGDAWILWGDGQHIMKFPARSFSGKPARCLPAPLGNGDSLDPGVPLRQLVV